MFRLGFDVKYIFTFYRWVLSLIKVKEEVKGVSNLNNSYNKYIVSVRI